MGSIEPFAVGDVGQVARLHALRFWGAADASTPGLEAYYRGVFLENPWFDPSIGALVLREPAGRITGFVGRICRPMQLGEASVRAAIGHRLLTSGESPVAALELVQAFLAGPQDFSFGDGGNDAGIPLLAFAGFSPCPLYSLGWLRVLRPLRLATALAARRGRAGASLHALLRPLTGLADGVVSRSSRLPLRVPPSRLDETVLDADALLACSRDFARPFELRPRYERAGLAWQLAFLAQSEQRGALGGFVCRSRGAALGACLYFLRSDRVIEVLYLAAAPKSRDDVLAQVIAHAHRRGAIAIVGRLEPAFLASYWKHGCLVRQADWAVVHSPRPEILVAIHGGKACLSGLDGELWLRSPMDRI
jgi:hypothetical protein